jgi:predicted NBD/HSP70 family sugar kinase
MLRFSKPTMSAAIIELTNLGLVEPFGLSQGAVGRKATLYRVGPQAGHVIGVDAGSTQVRAMAQTLDGRLLAEASESLVQEQKSSSPATGVAIAKVMGALRTVLAAEHGPLQTVAVALPVIVSYNRPELANRADIENLRALLGVQAGVRLVLENNVNCAALAEMHHGAALGRTSFAFLQVGVKIGLGIVHDGTLFRGFNGAAGEVSRLPFPWSEDRKPERNALEGFLGSQQLMARVKQTWPENEGEPPASAREMMERAAAGSVAALAAVEVHAADIGRLVTAVVSLLDPGLVVLGGGIGQSPLLIKEVSRVVDELAWRTEIATSTLGNLGTVQGATQLAAREALADLIGPERS